MKILPVGIQSFDMIQQENYLYVDKTKHIYDLVTIKKGRYFFLSRPRRFGKSLLVSTLKELFLGNKDLFENLWISTSDYTWKTYPTILLDFSTVPSRSPKEFYANLSLALDRIGKAHNIELSSSPTPEAKLEDLIIELAQNTGVVLLIDEYDRPLLQHVNNLAMMNEIQAILRDFYTIIKGMGSKVSFLFMTGITKFSKTSVFSGMNNLVDLTLSEEASDLLGYTEAEIDQYFQPYMQDIVAKEACSIEYVKNNMRHWYNGYQFSQRPEKVYNPFSVLSYLLNKDLRNYWFETGTPSFLVNLIRERRYSIEDLEHAQINIDNLSSFDIDKMQLIPLLLQTGYLTIKSYNSLTRNYELGYPNEETKSSFLLYFIEMIAEIETAKAKHTTADLTQSLSNGDLELFFSLLKTFFASIPYNIQISAEQYYQSIFYVLLSLCGVYVQAEVTTNNGRIDCTITANRHIYIFEFKLHDSAEAALAQIEEKQYYQKFLHDDKAIALIGVAFGMKTRNVGAWLSREL